MEELSSGVPLQAECWVSLGGLPGGTSEGRLWVMWQRRKGELEPCDTQQNHHTSHPHSPWPPSSAHHNW